MKIQMVLGALVVATAAAGCSAAESNRPALPEPAVARVAATVEDEPTTSIVGGTDANRSDYPYFVAVGASGFGTSPPCGGSVIAPQWVLTAAHCVDSNVSLTTTVHTLAGPTPGRVTMHPQWNGSSSAGHDLALVQIASSSTVGVPSIQVGDPWDAAGYAAGAPAMIMGIGRTSAHGPSGTFLVADTVIRSDDYMDDIFNSVFGYDYWNERLMIGAGSSRQTVCQGDSGGPLMATVNPDRLLQIGVASFTHTSWLDDGCSAAGGFAELAGPQLAWVASVVPAIMEDWGGCTTVNGARGLPFATYGTSPLLGPHRDVSYYWNIQCVSGGARLLQVRHSAMCGNVVPSSVANGNNLVQGRCANQLYNLFELSPSDDGHYRFIVAATNMCLGVSGSSESLRAKIRQLPCGSGWNQQFDLRATGDGYYQVVVRHSQMCMDVQGDYFTAGAHIWQYRCDLGYNQQFRFIQPKNCTPIATGSRVVGRPECPLIGNLQ